MKFEMMYQARMLSSNIIMAAMKNDHKNFNQKDFLQNLKHCRFDVGYYDKNEKPLYTEIEYSEVFDEEF